MTVPGLFRPATREWLRSRMIGPREEPTARRGPILQIKSIRAEVQDKDTVFHLRMATKPVW
jgi:hypothetical protein